MMLRSSGEFLLAAGIFGVFCMAAPVLDWIRHSLGDRSEPTAIVLFAIILFTVRLKLRFAYGVAEMMVACVVIGYAPRDGSTQGMVQFAAGIYLMIRGLDNAWESPVGEFHRRKFRRVPSA